jgi:prepilin-type N-terminal cleavage/methylation domain-containing protein
VKILGETERAARGFTLLEVVVAMTIVGLGVVTLLQIFSLGLRLGARSTVHTEAGTYGRQVMDEVLARRNLQDGTEQANAGASRHWKIQIQPVVGSDQTLDLSSSWDLKEVSLDMVVMDAGRERHVELKTLRLLKKKNR